MHTSFSHTVAAHFSLKAIKEERTKGRRDKKEGREERRDEKGRGKPVRETPPSISIRSPAVSPRPSSSQFTLKTGKNHPVLPLLFEKMSEK